MLSLSTKSDYGLLFLSLLAEKKNSGRYISIGEIVKKTKLPSAFLSRIAAELTSSGILKSREGVLGGYKLAKKPEEIDVASVIHVLEGSFAPTKCTSKEDVCQYETICPMCGSWQGEIKRKMLNVLENVSLKDLMKERR